MARARKCPSDRRVTIIAVSMDSIASNSWSSSVFIVPSGQGNCNLRALLRAGVADFLRLLAQVAVHQLFRELDALVFHELHVGIAAAVERHADGPRLREHF